MNLKSILEKIQSKITFENLDKTMNAIENGTNQISKHINTFSKGMEDLTNELSFENKKSSERASQEFKKSQKNLDRIWSSSKSNTKIWSDRLEK